MSWLKRAAAVGAAILALAVCGTAQAYDPKARQIKTDTGTFDNNLSAADDTVQDALETLDELTVGAGTGDITAVGDIIDGAAFTAAAPGKTLTFTNATSGTVTLQTVVGALGTQTISLPAGTGTVALTSDLHAAVTLGTDADVLLGLSTQQLTLDSQAINVVLAGPGTGSPGDPTFRALVDNDIPDSITVSLAAAASALNANGGNCSAGQAAAGVDASGAAEGCAAYLTSFTESDPLALLTAGTDNVKDTHIDWGTGAGQVSTDDVTQGSTNLYSTIGNIQSALSSDFHNIGGTDATGTDTLDDLSNNSIDDLSDVTITTAAAANLLIRNSGNTAWVNVALGGDATIGADGALAIGADKIALTTDTTGNYVSSATASGGLTLTGTEGGSLGVLLPAATNALSATTSSGSGLELLAGGLAIIQGCDDGQPLEWNETDDKWQCGTDNSGGGTANILDLGDDGGNDSVDLVEIATTGDTNNIFTESAADKLLIAVGNDWPKADLADAATALAADPANCASSGLAGGITAAGVAEACITPNAGTNIANDLEEEVTEGSLADNTIVTADIKDAEVAQADINDTATLAGNPAYGDSSVYFATTGMIFEGATSDNIEGLLIAADQTGADHTWTLPNETGTVCTTGSVCTGYQASGSYLTAVTADTPLSGSGTSGSHLVIANADDDGSTKGVANFTDADFDAVSGAVSIAAALTRDAEWDTEGEVQTAWGSVNILLETEIDASAELLAIMDDETGSASGSPLLVFNQGPTISAPILTGKIDRNNVAVDDDDCTGEQGLAWYDTTDSAFEWCNANSGAPAVLGGGSFDSTAVDATTWSDGANASNIWTMDVSGTDTTVTWGSALATFSHGVTVSGLLTADGGVTLGSGDDLNVTAGADLIFGTTTSLAETTGATDSGAYIVGVNDEFSYSAGTTVQGVLNDLDAGLSGVAAMRFLPQQAVLDDAAPPALTVTESTGTGTPRRFVADFDPTTDQMLYWTFVAPQAIPAGNWTVVVSWFANDTGANEDAIWFAQMSATTEADADSMAEDAMGAANTAAENVNATEANRLIQTPITLSNTDSVAAGDLVTLKIGRDADDSIGDADNDGLTSDARLVAVEVRFP